MIWRHCFGWNQSRWICRANLLGGRGCIDSRRIFLIALVQLDDLPLNLFAQVFVFFKHFVQLKRFSKFLHQSLEIFFLSLLPLDFLGALNCVLGIVECSILLTNLRLSLLMYSNALLFPDLEALNLFQGLFTWMWHLFRYFLMVVWGHRIVNCHSLWCWYVWQLYYGFLERVSSLFIVAPCCLDWKMFGIKSFLRYTVLGRR